MGQIYRLIENREHCEHGMYYYNYELENICPAGWHLGLKLKPTGFIQGEKKKKRNAADVWILDSTKNKVHLHIGDGRFLIHSYDFIINDKPRREGRMSVRCVKNQE